MGKAFLYGNGGSGGGLNKSVIIVTAPEGSTVTCSMGSTTKTATEKNGVWKFGGLDLGTWTLTATRGSATTTQDVAITRLTVEYVTLVYRMTPEFIYTGDYEIVDDSDNPISDFVSWQGNWKIRFLTSGIFTITNMFEFDGSIDIFLVGGGAGGGNANGGGGGAGYTKTVKNVPVSIGVSYEIVIGAGGTYNLQGNGTTFSNLSVDGGKVSARPDYDGGDGGSGGGGIDNGVGGIDGADGHGATRSKNGKGQGSTTREFGESDAHLYATGGNADRSGNPGAENTGDGGSGGSGNGGTGGSGIVIIRNHREEAA